MHFSKKTIYITAITLSLLLLFFAVIKPIFFFKKPPEYLTAAVTKMDIEDVVLASGTIMPIKYVKVGAQVTGQLKSLKVKLGERVKKGQLLAEIDPAIPQNELHKSEASLKQAQANKKIAEASLKQHEAALARQKIMLLSDASSQAEFENAQAQVDRTRAEIMAQEALIKVAMIGIETAKTNLGYTRISAPIDGEIMTIVTEEGQTVVSAQSAPVILVMANLDTMLVKAQISEADVLRVKPGLAVYFTTLGAEGKRFSSLLRVIEPTPEYKADNSAATAVYYNGLFDIPNPERVLKTAMTAQVSIVIAAAQQTLAIPVTALGLKKAKDEYEVEVLSKENIVQRRLIKTGISNHIHIQVLSGLSMGEKVIIGDTSKIDNTMPTSIVF